MNSWGIHALLKLQHHRHTGRPLEHHHTSYRALFVVLATAGLSMATIGYAAADDYSVTATVPGATITSPAVITEPVDATTLDNPNVTIKGTCQVVNTGTFVTIVRDGVPIGSGMCQGSGTFSIPVTLLLGGNAIRAKVESGLGVQGPDGQIVQLYYAPPPIPTAVPNGNAATPLPRPTISTSAAQNGFAINTGSNATFEHTLGQGMGVTVYLYNGRAPYSIEINWGDGQVEVVTVSDLASSVRIAHGYTSPGAHTVSLRALDGAGRLATFQFVIQTKGLPLLGAPVTIIHTPQPAWGQWSFVTQAAWISYATLVMAVVALWALSPTHTFWGWSFLHKFAHAPITKGRNRRGL